MRAHNIDIYEYRRRFPDTPTESEEALKAYSIAAVEKWRDPDFAQRVSEGNKGKVISEEVRQRLRELHTGNEYALGYVHTKEAKLRMSELATERMRDPKPRAQIAESVSKTLMGHETGEETKRKIRKSNLAFPHSENVKKLWKDPEYAHSVLKHRRPNGPELQLQFVLDKHFPSEWKYTGNGTFRVEGRNPDFINIDGKRQVIEVFGCYYHDADYFPGRPSEEELTAHYKKHDFDCLVFWEYDVYDEEKVVTRVKNFSGGVK